MGWNVDKLAWANLIAHINVPIIGPMFFTIERCYNTNIKTKENWVAFKTYNPNFEYQIQSDNVRDLQLLIK